MRKGDAHFIDGRELSSVYISFVWLDTISNLVIIYYYMKRGAVHEDAARRLQICAGL